MSLRKVRLNQFDEQLAKLTEDAMEVRAEVAKYLEESSRRSSSSSSHRNSRSYQRKPGDARDYDLQSSSRTFNCKMFMHGMEPPKIDTLPRRRECIDRNINQVLE